MLSPQCIYISSRMVGVASLQSEPSLSHSSMELRLTGRIALSIFVILHGVMASRILFELRDTFKEFSLQVFTRSRGVVYACRYQHSSYECS